MTVREEVVFEPCSDDSVRSAGITATLDQSMITP